MLFKAILTASLVAGCLAQRETRPLSCDEVKAKLDKAALTCLGGVVGHVTDQPAKCVCEGYIQPESQEYFETCIDNDPQKKKALEIKGLCEAKNYIFVAGEHDMGATSDSGEPYHYMSMLDVCVPYKRTADEEMQQCDSLPTSPFENRLDPWVWKKVTPCDESFATYDHELRNCLTIPVTPFETQEEANVQIEKKTACQCAIWQKHAESWVSGADAQCDWVSGDMKENGLQVKAVCDAGNQEAINEEFVYSVYSSSGHKWVWSRIPSPPVVTSHTIGTATATHADTASETIGTASATHATETIGTVSATHADTASETIATATATTEPESTVSAGESSTTPCTTAGPSTVRPAYPKPTDVRPGYPKPVPTDVRPGYPKPAKPVHTDVRPGYPTPAEPIPNNGHPTEPIPNNGHPADPEPANPADNQVPAGSDSDHPVETAAPSLPKTGRSRRRARNAIAALRMLSREPVKQRKLFSSYISP
ncbi:hypothetical protein HDU86_001629 [Geranomyces michiganensis]|nr:hypothetical protein HDU86_001629 [Geranomyces michiganensis]